MTQHYTQFRVEKRRAAGQLTLSTGESLLGSFFLAGGSAMQAGPERVIELLNAEAGFFPFARSGASEETTMLVNRAHLVAVKLLEAENEAALDAGYEVARARRVTMVLSTGLRLSGTVRIHKPAGHDRLSDYARTAQGFGYLENADGTFVVNAAHVVELSEDGGETE